MNNSLAIQVGQRIRQQMEAINLSQVELASRVGVTPAAMSRYLSGLRLPRSITAARISDELGVSMEWLLGNEDPSQKSDLNQAVSLVTRSSRELTAEQKRAIINALILEGDENE